MATSLSSKDALTLLAKNFKISTWEALILFVKNLPYGRNTNRHDVSLVFIEKKGSCSSKHALLKAIADENNLPNIQLFLGIYKMNHLNTNIHSIITDNGLNYIPEAHCYLKIDGVTTDVTSENASFEKIKEVLISEIEIAPEQVAQFKVDYHKEFLKNWIVTENISKTFEDVWSIREKCIAYLSK